MSIFNRGPREVPKSMRILVVDDDRDNADSLADLFQMEGHEVEVAYNGKAAIAAYERLDFDIAFMDVMMPGLNGVESFLEIKRRKPNANVFMMTGFSVEQLLRQAVDNGAIGVMTKPLIPERVVQALDNVLPAGIVLVAEDDPAFGTSLCRLIERAGKSCVLLSKGEGAVERISRGGVDVLVIDSNMPLVDGIGIYTSLRKAGNAVPTVMIRAGVDDYSNALTDLPGDVQSGILTKPFDLAALLERLDQFASSSRRCRVSA